ncbi:MAG: PKD domain-containing protein [Bacteroidota bacterium]
MKKIYWISGLFMLLIVSSHAQSIYNYKGSGALNALTSWTLSPGGTNPPNFTNPNQVFVLTNVSSTTLSAAGWTVSGTGSEIRIGNGSSSTNLAVNTNATLMVSSGAKLRVQNNGTLSLYQANLSYLPSSADVILDNGSTVNWAQASAVNIWPLNYWNLTVKSTGKNLASSTSATVQNQYSSNNQILSLSASSAFYVLGNVNGNLGLRSTVSTSSIIIGGSGTSSVNITLPVNDQTFGYFELSRNSLVKWNKSSGTWVMWSSSSVSTGTVDITGLSNNHILYVRGNTTLGATWRVKNTLTLRVNGSVSISGNLLFDSGFNNLGTLLLGRTGQTLTLGNALNVYTEVNVTAGTLNANGNLTLKSSATQKARINVLGASSDITGNVTVETFAAGGNTGWTNLAVAGVSGQTMASGWGDDFPMTCPSGCPNGSTAGGSPFTSVTTYNETNDTYPGIPNGSAPITPGVGYWVYLGNGQTTTTDILIDVTGPIVKKNAGSWSFTTGGAGNGWNLVGNPYPSTISFTKTFSSSYGTGKMANELRVWNPDLNSGSGDYALYKVGVGSTPPVSSGGIDDNIPTGQGFYIVANSNFSLGWQETYKTTSISNNPLLKTMNTTPEPNRLFYLKLTGAGGANTYCGINFNSNASLNYDANLDAENFEPYPGAPQVIVVASNKNLKVKSIPYPNGSESIDVQVQSGTNGTYQLALTGVENIPYGACVTLIDHLTNTSHNLLSSPYTFTHNGNTSTPRFTLNIQMSNLSSPVTNIISAPQCYKDANGTIESNMGSGSYNFVWKDVNNQILRSVSGVSKDSLKNISEGWYFVEVSDGNCSNVTKAVQLQASVGIPVADFTTNADTLPVNTPFIFTNTSQNLSIFNWDFGDGNTSTTINPTHTYSNPGNYLVLMQGINSCGDTVTTFKDLIVTTVTGLNLNGVPTNPSLWISRDANGYFVSSNYTKDTKVNLLVTDVLGRNIMKETILLGNSKKVYLKNLPSQQIIVIRAEDGYNVMNKKVFVE